MQECGLKLRELTVEGIHVPDEDMELIRKTIFAVSNEENRPIFTFKMLSEKGEVVYLNSLDAEKIEVKEQKNRLELNYINIKKTMSLQRLSVVKTKVFYGQFPLKTIQRMFLNGWNIPKWFLLMI